MGWKARFKPKLRELADRFTLNPKRTGSDQSGIALFMVIAAMTILSVLVTEFTYVAQVNSRMAFDSTDQIKAHYLAKTGLKVSLLRLRAYRELKAFGSGGGGSGLPKVPKQLLDQIWSFPFVYPLPSNLPGMTVFARDEIAKFVDESGLEGRFTATIESDSDKLNLNSMIADFVPKPEPSASPSKTPSPGASGAAAGGQSPGASPSPSPSNPYDPKEAREGMKRFITQLVEDKFKADPDFAAEYRDLQIEELFDNILGWIDYTHQPRNSSGRQTIPYKRAPFYSVSELRMIYPIDDALYDLLAPNFTTSMTSGINVNLIKEPMLRALFPNVEDEEVVEFFKSRDSPDEDGTFQTPDDFWKYVERSFAAYRSTDDLKKRFAQQGIKIITDEEVFKITVLAQVNQATRVLEAWVTLESSTPAKKTANPNPFGQPAQPNPVGAPAPGSTPAAPAGLRITFVRES